MVGLLLIALTFVQPGSLLDHVSKYTVGVDFIAYWASGRLLLENANPYAYEHVFELQKSVGWMISEPLVMYNPPWVLTFILPFSTRDYVTGKAAWMITCLVFVFASSYGLWKFYGGTDHDRGWHLLLIASFSPILFMILKAQIAFILLVGTLGFLHFERQRKCWIAGVFAALTLVKPHALFLFWVAILLWTMHQRRWKILAGSLLTALLMSLAPLYYNPDVYNFYVQEILTRGHQYHWLTPTWGTVLRSAGGKEQQWLQFIPPLFGLIWLFVHWTGHRNCWVWANEMPRIIFVSLISNFYIWVNDFALCLVPLTQAALLIVRNQVDFRVSCFTILAYLLTNIASWVIYLRVQNEFWLFWMAPFLLALYAHLMRNARMTARLE